MSRDVVISVVVPLYNEEKNVPIFVERVKQVFSQLDCAWEIVFALDPSPDATEQVIDDLMKTGFPIRLVKFSRRVGKPLSLMAGLEHAAGDACVVMDVDLQDPPELIADMIEKWKQGYKVVIAQRTSRKGENPLYLKAAALFYRILEWCSDVPIPRDAGDYRLLDARVVREICRFRERHGFLRGITAAAGFSTALIPFDRDPRFQGRTQISVLGAVNIALDGIIPFSRVPVRLIFVVGVVMLVLATLLTGMHFVSGLWTGLTSTWYLGFLTSVSLVFCAMTVTALGVVGEYLVRTYEEARDRPLYVVDQVRESDAIPRRRQSTPQAGIHEGPQ